MSAMFKFLNLARNVTTICSSVTNRTLQRIQRDSHLFRSQQHVSLPLCVGAAAAATRPLHTTPVRADLMEFFENPKNWEENEVKVGRAWRLDELRIKSNKELHQLWYILLKERNMLLTMEHECNEKMQLFSSPERLDKVKISMDNLESVVRERNKAYHLLETGVSGERPTRRVANNLGINYTYKSCEHVLPPHMNTKWIKARPIGYGGRAVRKFLLAYRERLYNVKRRQKNRSRNEVMMILRRNPNSDVDVLRRQFPGADIERLRRSDQTRGHFVPKVGV